MGRVGERLNDAQPRAQTDTQVVAIFVSQGSPGKLVVVFLIKETVGDSPSGVQWLRLQVSDAGDVHSPGRVTKILHASK